MTPDEPPPPLDAFDHLQNGLAAQIRPLFSSLDGADPHLGRRVGSYELKKRLGAGGFGAVYLAERQDKTRKKVAIKLLLSRYQDEETRRRFGIECRIIARLEHENIARFIESGETEDGLLYLVMEFVEGAPIDCYCDAKCLSIRDRVGLFLEVCKAVQAAHIKRFIHRDIKPSNILIQYEKVSDALNSRDQFRVPKLLDFGIAKVKDPHFSATEITLGGRPLTYDYASPEQLELDSEALDFRTDVYSLGVVLYQLLTSHLPHTLAGLTSAEIIEKKRTTPRRPSELVRSDVATTRRDPASGETTTRTITPADIAKTRDGEPSAVHRQLRGDLDNIVLKALSSELNLNEDARRYDSVQDLADDLRRWLQGYTVKATPPTLGYRVRKFVRRNRKAVISGCAAVVLLIVGLIGITWSLHRARMAEADAKQFADRFVQVATFQASQLSEINVERMGARLRRALIAKRRVALEARELDRAKVEAQLRDLDASLVDVNFTNLALETLDENIFEHALKAIHEQFGDQPLIKAWLLGAVAKARHEVGLLEQAIAPQSEALDIYRRVYGNDHPATRASMIQMGSLLRDQGKLSEAEPYLRKALASQHHIPGDDDWTLILMTNMGLLLHSQGKLVEAEPYYRESLDMSRRVLGDDHPQTLLAMVNMGFLLNAQGNWVEAEAYYREAMDGFRRVLGNDHKETLRCINNVGASCMQRENWAEAEKYIREALEGRRRVLGDAHPDTLLSINNMGRLLQKQGKLAEAEPYLREALLGRRRVLGDDHQDTIGSMNDISLLLLEQDNSVEAEKCCREALERGRNILGNDHPLTLTSVGNMGLLLQNQGKYAEAAPYIREALEGHRRVLGDAHPDTLRSINSMGHLLQKQGKFAEAEPYISEALRARRRVLGNDHPSTLISISLMGALLERQGKLPQAELYDREALERCRRVLGDDHQTTLTAIFNMGSVLASQGNLAEAEPYNREAIQRCRRVLGDDHPQTLISIYNMGALLLDRGKLSEAEPYCREALERCRRALGDDHPQTLTSINIMGVLLRELERFEEAEALGAEAVRQARKALPAEHPYMAVFLSEHARTLVAMERFAEAETEMLEAHEKFVAAKVPDDERAARNTKAIIGLYEGWNAANPSKGYDAKAAEWRANLGARQASPPSAASQPITP